MSSVICLHFDAIIKINDQLPKLIKKYCEGELSYKTLWAYARGEDGDVTSYVVTVATNKGKYFFEFTISGKLKEVRSCGKILFP